MALRVEAVHTILNNLIVLIPESQRKSTLYELGYKVGESWAREFLKEYALVGYGTVGENYPTLFEQWSYYDATAGFGRFTFAVSHKDPKGTVLLYNSALSRTKSYFPLNHYFSGYIAGTINTLWAKERAFRGRSVVVELCAPSVQAEKIVAFDVRVTS